MKKSLKVLIIVSSIVVVLFSAVMIYYFGASYPLYEKYVNEEFKIPGLNDGFTPQGFDYNDVSESYLISGYMKDESASRIYIVKNEDVKFVTLTVDGKDFTGHMGGITSYGNCVWISSEKKVYRFDLNNVIMAKNGDKVNVIDYFETNNGADSILAKDGMLWVGEFYKKGKYDTESSHHILTKSGETNYAITFCYEINENEEYGIKSTTPIKGISTPSQVQGMEILDDGKIVFSTSYSIPSSHLLIYKSILQIEHVEDVLIDGNSIPVYVLSSSDLVCDIKAPSMSEEIVLKDNKLFILYESASKKYKLVNRTRIDKVHVLDIKAIIDSL